MPTCPMIPIWLNRRIYLEGYGESSFDFEHEADLGTICLLRTIMPYSAVRASLKKLVLGFCKGLQIQLP